MLGIGNINIHRTWIEKCLDKLSFGRLKAILENTINKGVQGIETVVDETQL
jgi:hypothetical protein